MKRVFLKVLVALLAALLGVGLILYQQNQMKKGFEIPQHINGKLQVLHADLISLQHTVLEANYFLYYNNDRIYKKIEDIRHQIERLMKQPYFAESAHKKSFQAFMRLKHHFSMLAETINDFLTLNASLKNSSIYLPTLALKAYDLFDINDPGERRIILTLSKINASLFLAKNALDESFIKELARYKEQLAGMVDEAETEPKKRLLETSIRHLALFVELFPKFHRELRAILDPSIQEELKSVINVFTQESSREIQNINRLGMVLLTLYLITIGIVVYFVFHSEKEYLRLKRIKEQLQHSLVTDHLTGLGNREAYMHERKRMRNPALILVNIDRFKHINEFYGSTVGDHLLQAVAQLLEEIMPEKNEAHIYRLGGDDFGILFECSDPNNLKNLIVDILNRFEETTFSIDSLDIDISVSVGASTARKLFETADMALKTVKASRRKRYAIYDPSLDVSETIANNIHALRQLKTAITQDAVIPFFQPIVDLRSGKTLKYEALARLRVGENETVTPFFFIEAAKQAKLSGIITTRILKQTLAIAEKSGATFSVNLSAEDIVSEHDKRQIFSLLEQHRQVASSIVFEILETEEIEDYEIISEFIRHVKRYGCQVSIDDFGSGYSNFEKLLQLDIDIIKIDGSLIRDVDHNSHAELVVQTIIDFAKGAELLTVAEFVHSKAVFEKVEVLGVDYAQGYYLGEPKPADHYFNI